MKRKTIVLSEKSTFDLQREIEFYEKKGYSAIQPMQVNIVSSKNHFFTKDELYTITMQK